MITKKKVAVAMSGGVDSSLAAALLLEKNFDVIGVSMLLFGEDNQQFISDAKNVADFLGIKFYIANFRADFKKTVMNYFIEEYLNGRTPNPCVMCNKKIKFGKLFDYAKELGADFLATGHYARIIFEDGRYKLKKALDLKKDQSYVLYNLTAAQLEKIILPIGEFNKTETRAIAEEYNLPVAHKKDSQEICFVPNNDYKNFIKKFAPNSDAFQVGEIADTTGKILGTHEGVANYTIGQRKGLGIAAEYPLYVNKIDVAHKKIIVGKNEELFRNNLIAENVHWIYKPEKFPAQVQAKIRYGYRVADCKIIEQDKNIFVEFTEPQRAITAGQSVVFYIGDEVIGGGIIGG